MNISTPNKSLQRTAFHAAAELNRSAVEVSIEKYEKTAMQWLQEQTKTN